MISATRQSSLNGAATRLEVALAHCAEEPGPVRRTQARAMAELMDAADALVGALCDGPSAGPALAIRRRLACDLCALHLAAFASIEDAWPAATCRVNEIRARLVTHLDDLERLAHIGPLPPAQAG